MTNHGIIAPVHDREVVDGLKAIDRPFIFQLMSTVKLTDAKSYDMQMFMNT